MGALNFPDPATDGLVHEKWQFNAAEDKWELIPVQLSPVEYTAGNGLDLTDYEFSLDSEVVQSIIDESPAGLWDSQGSGVISYTDGNVGIGTASPAAAFEVRGTDASARFRGSDVEILNVHANAGGSIQLDARNSTAFDFARQGTSVLTINSSDNVGIGTTNPIEKLHVNGKIVSAPIQFSSNQNGSYLVAGTNNYDGTTTNWGTQGFHHKIKTNSGGSPRISIDTPAYGEAFTVLTNGKVGINKNNPSATLDVTGTITASGDVTAFSDIAVKEDINPITEALSKVSQLGGYTFKRKNDDSRKYTGVIAQEVQKVLPEAVHGGEEGLSVAYGNLVGLLIEAVKEQQVQINELKDKLEK